MEKKTAKKIRRTLLIVWILLSIIVLAAILYLGSAYPDLQGILQKAVLVFIGLSAVVGGINGYFTKMIRK